MKTMRGSFARLAPALRVLPFLLGLAWPAVSSAAAARPAGVLLAANEEEGTLSVIDPRRDLRIAKIAEGGFGGGEVDVGKPGRRELRSRPLDGDLGALAEFRGGGMTTCHSC